MFGVGAYVKKYLLEKELRKKGIEIGLDTQLAKDAVLEPPVRIKCDFVNSGVRIGKFSYIERGGAIYENVSIGRYCAIKEHRDAHFASFMIGISCSLSSLPVVLRAGFRYNGSKLPWFGNGWHGPAAKRFFVRREDCCLF